MNLYEALSARVEDWRGRGHLSEDYPAVAEVLAWAGSPAGEGFRLRAPQLRALETYWYLRLEERTLHVLDLYRRVYPKKRELVKALGVREEAFAQTDYELEELWEKVRGDDEFVREFGLEALRETLTLDYASYVLALAMGTGKTALIGAIFATEFALALEYPDGPFVQNALVFAPGRTIIESLRELAALRYERILPPRLYKPFMASVKLTFTRDGEKDIPVTRGSLFNVVVTNTEKIRIQKEQVRRSDLGPLFSPEREEEARAEVANLRLQTIASLPHLAVFSDEAHHLYGQSLGSELKKVRKTVDYVAARTNVVCVVNTTGTPFFGRQPLRDVVAWYGLSQGIRDGILKEVGEVVDLDFGEDTRSYVARVVEDFFREYGGVSLPDGTPAKLAIYFPQTEEAERMRAVVELKLRELGIDTSVVFEHHTRNENQQAFNRFRFRDSPHRVALLVDRGVEGWDVPALFACALARELRGRNNFVLQAASRCLRQVPGNTVPARIYLSPENRVLLQAQLNETFKESLEALSETKAEKRRVRVRLRKPDAPPLVVRQTVRRVVRREASRAPLRLARPEDAEAQVGRITAYTLAAERAAEGLLRQLGETVEVEAAVQSLGLYEAACEMASVYRADFWELLAELRRVYGEGAEVPHVHLAGLARQIEEQRRDYETREEHVERTLALVKREGFELTTEADGSAVYTAEIDVPLNPPGLLLEEETRGKGGAGFGFHYAPYNFDSHPEKDFFRKLLLHVGEHPENVEDVYFTGAFTSPKKTDFFVEYMGEDERWHSYTPDFVVRCRDGRCLIVEVKDGRYREVIDDALERETRGQEGLMAEGRKSVALKRWTELNPDALKYAIVYAAAEVVPDNEMEAAREFVKNCGKDGAKHRAPAKKGRRRA